MKAIVAKYLAPTTHRGARVKVFAEGWDPIVGGSITSWTLMDRRDNIGKEYCPREEGERRPAYKLIKGTLPGGDLVFCLGQFN